MINYSFSIKSMNFIYLFLLAFIPYITVFMSIMQLMERRIRMVELNQELIIIRLLNEFGHINNQEAIARIQALKQQAKKG